VPEPSKNQSEPKALALDESLLPPGEPILAAVSGGADSMALLFALLQTERRITVAHINHGLRGAESDADEAFVRQHCEKLGIPVVTRKVDLSQHGDWVGEAEARDARYRALEEIAAETSCTLVATGHTADDALETILINMLRGATVAGLAGMPNQRPLGAVTLVRPLWQATREETHHACLEAGWAWREDATNGDPRYLRNRVRLQVIPALGAACEGGQERLLKQVARSASLLRVENDYLAEIAREKVKEFTMREEPGLLTLDGLRFRTQHIALQRRILREAAQQVTGGFYSSGSEQIEEVRRHIIADAKRAVWCREAGLRIEWTGAMAGNRIRFWVVGDED
jgi:tRNA(Ile)-lysidine synthase